jgi:ADP-dependent NAD(P)H-hydrate dehydratase / NAD(P)H-hydrate epimerase
VSQDYWQKQTHDEPLYPDLIWSRPQSKHAAGKLLIIGGNAHGFAAPAEAYQVAGQSGAGLTRVLLPLSVKQVVKGLLETVDFAPSTPSGSFAKSALADWLDQAIWADGVLLAGDFGRNSETAILLEYFLDKYTGPVVLAKDTVDNSLGFAEKLANRPQTLIVATVADLQKLFKTTHQPVAITFDMNLIKLVEALHEFTLHHPSTILVKHLNNYVLAGDGRIITSPAPEDLEQTWRVPVATTAAVWWMQNPTKPLEAISSSFV